MKSELVQTAAQNPVSLKLISMSSQIQFSATIFLLLRHLEGSKGRWSEQKTSGVAINNSLNPTVLQKPRC